MAGSFILILVLVVACLGKKSTTKFRAKLVNIKEITHDTKVFTFDLPSGMNQIGLKIG